MRHPQTRLRIFVGVRKRLIALRPLKVCFALFTTWITAIPSHGGDIRRYYAYPGVEDRCGVIAPWYHGQNGQCDFRVRIAAETLKRYPWADMSRAAMPGPEFIYNGTWQISTNGTITIPALNNWNNGDYGQRGAYLLSALVDYYRYSGDAAAIGLMTLQADAMLAYGQTGPDYPWPNFLVSVPNKGKPYGQCDPHGMIQLDIVAEAGLALVRAYEVTGKKSWLEAAGHWADLLAAHRNHDPSRSPWNRYANPEDVRWNDEQTGGVVYILAFFDELIRAGYNNRPILDARDAGLTYLRDVLLPRWTVNDTWGRNYWDWEDGVQAENVTEVAVRYLIEHPREFPNWRSDARNILSLFLNHTSVSPNSSSGVFSGAWAYPESCGCCGRSLWYGPLELAPVYAQYGTAAESKWGRELGRRQTILATYDVHENGVVEDNIDGGQIVAGGWFKIAHPMALKYVLLAMAWMPDAFGAAAENHIMNSSAVVNAVRYEKGKITYSTFDAPANSVDVLRLAFRPKSVMANGRHLSLRHDLAAKGWKADDLGQGDCLVSVRHDGERNITVEGEDPAEVATCERFDFSGGWHAYQNKDASGRVSSVAGAAMKFSFAGNQVRITGDVGPTGGLADVFLDGMKQPAGIDCWNPIKRERQLLYYRNGLANQLHHLEVAVRGAGNLVSQGSNIWLNSVQWSAVERLCNFGEDGGPTETQRFIFGYDGRTDWKDSAGHAWRPGTEFIVRSGNMTDSVAASWWREPRRIVIGKTSDPNLYRYGIHAHDFTVYVTVGVDICHARLKFCETRNIPATNRTVNIQINGEDKVTNLDIAATAGGHNNAVDLVFDGIHPRHGMVELHLSGSKSGEAILQALEVDVGPGGKGAKAVCFEAK